MGKVYTVGEAADIIGRNAEYIRHVIRIRKLKAKKFNGRWLVSQNEIELLQKSLANAGNKHVCSRCKLSRPRRGKRTCDQCHTHLMKSEKKTRQNKKPSEYALFLSEQLILRPVVYDRQEEIGLMALLQLYAVAQLTETPCVAVSDIEAIMRNLGLISKTASMHSCLKRAEKSGWLSIIWNRTPVEYILATSIASQLGIDHDTIARWIKEGKIEEARRDGSVREDRWLIPIDWRPTEELEEEQNQ